MVGRLLSFEVSFWDGLGCKSHEVDTCTVIHQQKLSQTPLHARRCEIVFTLNIRLETVGVQTLGYEHGKRGHELCVGWMRVLLGRKLVKSLKLVTPWPIPWNGWWIWYSDWLIYKIFAPSAKYTVNGVSKYPLSTNGQSKCVTVVIHPIHSWFLGPCCVTDFFVKASTGQTISDISKSAFQVYDIDKDVRHHYQLDVRNEDFLEIVETRSSLDQLLTSLKNQVFEGWPSSVLVV